ncbi:M13 family metallopeptidase [Pseudoalteromonas sp. MMG012]|uniref:M13 family metallopeptidase n=1 Tax=Pseudoalteromonas sp. MMG012 TaxID=2822686 RepID=UPI001B3A562F|nr:M13 family metallopeptidase [Pseudoalteromonas sp. MMG012]MBQ4851897.1 M13 family metallopeptidase [Pseudoalteromonas sp. MMG012]
MKNISLAALGVAISLGVAGCSEPPTESKMQVDPIDLNKNNKLELKSGIELNNIDTSVRAEDDFYYHVNGKWLEKTAIPADKSSYGSFTALYDESQKALRKVLDDALKNTTMAVGSDEYKLSAFYGSYMDEIAREELALSPLKAYLEPIDSLTSRADLPRVMASMLLNGGTTPFGWYVNNDAKKSNEYALYLYQSGLGLPDRDFYLKDTEKFVSIRAAYKTYIQQVFIRLGYPQPEQAADNILELESRIAAVQWSRVESRDATKTYNKLSMVDANRLIPSFDLESYFVSANLNVTDVVINQPSYLENLAKVVADSPLETWQHYLTFHFVNNHAELLNKEMVNLKFNFFDKMLRGVQEQAPIWKKAVDSSNEVLGELLGKIYVETYFPPEAKARMTELVSNLIKGFDQAIDDLEWMSPETKIAAKDKLSKFTPKIGYPDKWRDYSQLQISPDDLLGNYVRYTQWSYNDMINKIGKPVDRSEWFMTPQTVNAYYNPVNNEIVFPAAILQPPFFNLEADDAVNYGAIGAVIGHELGHGFDDQGSKYDGEGNLRNWWSESDLTQFEQRGSKLVAQYNQFSPFEDAHVNGELTLGENIGDLGGLTVSYKAYLLSLAKRKAPIIDGYTGEQRFFMGWAQIWRRQYRDEELRNRLMTDSHSPSHYRVIGVLPNMPEFYKAFKVKEGDGMYIPSAERVKIW